VGSNRVGEGRRRLFRGEGTSAFRGRKSRDSRRTKEREGSKGEDFRGKENETSVPVTNTRVLTHFNTNIWMSFYWVLNRGGGGFKITQAPFLKKDREVLSKREMTTELTKKRVHFERGNCTRHRVSLQGGRVISKKRPIPPQKKRKKRGRTHLEKQQTRRISFVSAR